jgi:hypothetical protein
MDDISFLASVVGRSHGKCRLFLDRGAAATLVLKRETSFPDALLTFSGLPQPLTNLYQIHQISGWTIFVEALGRF